VASLVGDIAVGPDGKSSVHVHAVLGRRDGTALAGHLQEGRVRPTLEIIVTESPAHLCKVKDQGRGERTRVDQRPKMRSHDGTRLDWLAALARFKAVLLEGLEVVFIVIALSARRGLLIPASAGALAACLLVAGVGIVVH
jgi:hypothetical protein